MKKTTPEQFKEWLQSPEERDDLEFKTAANSFSFSKDLPDYCAGLANVRGGKLILGVSDERHVVGTNAFKGTSQTLPNKLLSSLGICVDVEEFIYEDKRILIFHIPSRNIATIISSTGNYKYPMRVGNSLVEMSQDKIKDIHDEANPDFSTEIINSFLITDIDEVAISVFKKLWAEKQKVPEYNTFSTEKVLKSIGVLTDVGLNYAGLVLFGKKEKIDQFLPGAEVIYEWRQEEKIMHDYRKEWRMPFFAIFEDIWTTIDARNIRFPFQEGFVQREVYAFTEKSIREAVLNAVTHRDYRINSASVFIKASPNNFIIKSPGGFVTGITETNALSSTEWRNRRIAEIFQLAGLVERAGQGLDTIFENTIKEGKGLPDFSGSDQYSVTLRIPAKVKDENFILFLEKVIDEKQIPLSFEEIYELEQIREKQKVTNTNFKNKFLASGIIERIGKTRGSRYMLGHKYYSFNGKLGTYTRIVGVSRDAKKQLIVQHIKKNEKGFAKDFDDIFPDLKRQDISNLLQELKAENKIFHKGSARSGYWEILN